MRHPWIMPLVTALLSLGLAQGQPSHTVQKGDTLYSIARKYGTTVERISELNGLTGTALEVGRTLRLPSTVSHTVQKGDTLFSISKKYGSSVEAIQRENKLGTGGLIVGSRLKVPVGTPAPVKPAQPAPTAAKPPRPESQPAPVAQVPQSAQVVQPKPAPGGSETSSATPEVFQPLIPSGQPIPAPKPDLDERTRSNLDERTRSNLDERSRSNLDERTQSDLDEPIPTSLPKPPPRGQSVQLVNPQALPMTVVTLPDNPQPTASPSVSPKMAEALKAEATAKPEPSKAEASVLGIPKVEPVRIETPVSPKDEPLVKTEVSTPKEEPAPRPEPLKEEIVLPKQPSIPAGGDYNPNHPLMPVVLKYLGTPYIFGANSDRAVDCSAFVQQVFNDLGMKVPRTSREQWAFFPATTKLLQGDLVFFSFGGKQIDHVGIYLGRNVFVHANSYESRVVIESLDAPTYKRVYRGGRSTNLGQLLAASGH